MPLTWGYAGGFGWEGVGGVGKVSSMNPFREAAEKYRKAGWFGTLPLPYGKKESPPTGFTGHHAEYPTSEQVREWLDDGKRHNICIRLAGVDKEGGPDGTGHEVIGIDVDHYVSGGKDKKGGEQLAKLEDSLGKLPPTWISSAREDGISGIRYFRVPRGFAFRGQIDKDIEVIQKGHRYAIVWPSVHPEAGTYWWFDGTKGVLPDSMGRGQWDGVLPDARTLPLLPEEWINYLTQGGMRVDGTERIDKDSSVDEIYAWAKSMFHGSDGEMCSAMAKAVEWHKEKISSEATSHDKIVDAHYNLISLALEGHLGWNKAIGEIEEFWAADVEERDKRNRSELNGEIWRSRTNGLRKAKAQTDQRIKIGAAPIALECSRSGMCGDGDVGDDDDPVTGVERGPTGEIGNYERNDEGNAALFAHMYGNAVRYVEGKGWLVWRSDGWLVDERGDDGMRRLWHKVRKEQDRYLKDLKQKWDDEIAKADKQQLPTTGSSAAVPDSLIEARNIYKVWHKFFEDNGNQGRFERMLKSLKGVNSIQLDINQLDKNPYLLGVANGVLELTDENVKLREARMEDLITLNTGVPWEEPTQFAQQKWDEYLETFLPDPELRKLSQVALGHTLIGGNPEKVMIVLKGNPDTGKSTMVNALETALGDYAASVTQTAFQSHKLNPMLQDVLTCRTVVCSEFDENQPLSVAMVKRITGNNDRVRVELKGSNARIEGIPQSVPVLATNAMPTIPGADKALKNRLYPIPFNVKPKEIKKEYSNLIHTICGPAILNWLIEGYKEYRNIGCLPKNKLINDELEEIMSEMDEVHGFAYDMILTHDKKDRLTPVEWAKQPEWCVSVEEVFTAFCDWWSANSYQESRRPAQPTVTRKLKDQGFQYGEQRVDGVKNRYFFGIKLKKGKKTSHILSIVPQNQKGKSETD